MKRLTLDEKFRRIKEVNVNNESIGIHSFGLLHDIADALGMQHNSGGELHYLSNNITRLMRRFIEAGYPVKEYRIKCCSWTEKETWHPCFTIEEENRSGQQR